MPPLSTAIAGSSILIAAALPAQTDPIIQTDTVRIHGKAVGTEDGRPLAGCRVRLTGHQSTGYALAWGRGDWADPPEVITDADGAFEFKLSVPAADEALDRARFHLRIQHPERVSWFSHGTFWMAQRGGGVDYGAIRLPKGVRPRVRCEDTNGVIQPGVALTMRLVERDATLDGPEIPGVASWLESGLWARTDIRRLSASIVADPRRSLQAVGARTRRAFCAGVDRAAQRRCGRCGRRGRCDGERHCRAVDRR